MGIKVAKFGGSSLADAKQFEMVKAILLSDPDSPLKVSLEAFNPMIPNDSKNSSIPGAFFEIKVKNCSAVESRLSVACALANPFEVSRNKALNSGVFLENAGAAGADPAAGDLTLLADGGEVFVQESWYRGRWQDGVILERDELSRRTPQAELRRSRKEGRVHRSSVEDRSSRGVHDGSVPHRLEHTELL